MTSRIAHEFSSLLEQLSVTPADIVEPLEIDVVFSKGAGQIASICAPPVVTPSDLTSSAFPEFIRPGDKLSFDLVLGKGYGLSHGAASVLVALHKIVQQVRPSIRLMPPPAALSSAPAMVQHSLPIDTLRVDAGRCCVVVSASVPVSAQLSSVVLMDTIFLSGISRPLEPPLLSRVVAGPVVSACVVFFSRHTDFGTLLPSHSQIRVDSFGKDALICLSATTTVGELKRMLFPDESATPVEPFTLFGSHGPLLGDDRPLSTFGVTHGSVVSAKVDPPAPRRVVPHYLNRNRRLPPGAKDIGVFVRGEELATPPQMCVAPLTAEASPGAAWLREPAFPAHVSGSGQVAAVVASVSDVQSTIAAAGNLVDVSGTPLLGPGMCAALVRRVDAAFQQSSETPIFDATCDDS
jgi:hypothetical protein